MSTLLTRDPETLKKLVKQVFGPMQAPPKVETQAEQIRRLRPYLRKELRRGLTYDQLVTGLAGPEFNIQIKASSLRRLLSERRPLGGALAVQARVDAANAAARQ